MIMIPLSLYIVTLVACALLLLLTFRLFRNSKEKAREAYDKGYEDCQNLWLEAVRKVAPENTDTRLLIDKLRKSTRG